MGDTSEQPGAIIGIDNVATAYYATDSFDPVKQKQQEAAIAAAAQAKAQAAAEPPSRLSILWNQAKDKAGEMKDAAVVQAKIAARKIGDAAGAVRDKFGYGTPPPVAVAHFNFGHGNSETIVTTGGHTQTSFHTVTSYPEVVQAGQAMAHAAVTNAPQAHNEIVAKPTGAVTNALDITRR